MKRKILSMLMALVMIVSMLPVTAAAAGYQDTNGHWAEEAIERWSDHGIIQGNNGKFNPDGALTRAHMAAILCRLLALPEAGSYGFKDVEDSDWFAPYINACAAAGIMLGNNGYANPNSPITRQQAIVMLARALGIAPVKNPDLSDYEDADQVADYAAGYIAAMAQAGIVKGTSATTLSVGANITRAATVTILHRAIDEYVTEAGAKVDASDVDGIILVVAKNVTITNAPEGTVVVIADNVGSVKVNGKTVSDDQVYEVPAKTTASGGSSGGGGGSSHSHTYGAWVSNDDGTHTRTYTCGHVGSQTASCTYVEGVCSVCGYDSTAVAKIGNTYYATLSAAIETATDSTPVEIVILKTGDNALTTNIKIAGDRNITLRGVTGDAADVKLAGQIATTSSTAGTLTIKDLTILVDNAIVDSTGISQTAKSAIAVWGNQTVNCENIVFDMSLSDSTAITGWWDTGEGTTINTKNCVFNCNGQRPLRSCGNMTVEGCTFNDPYRYAIQLTAKASTATELENAVVTFKNNTINAGTISSKTVVYGIQLEGESYGCSDLIINGEGNTINLGETGKTGTMYYCECGKVDHTTLVWNTEIPAVHEDADGYSVSGKNYEVFSVDGLINIGTVLAAAQPSEGNILTVDLLVDADLTGKTWAPIEPMWIVFNGNGHTISNLNCGKGSYGRSGFWAYGGAVTINDLTLKNVTSCGTQAGTFAGSAEGLKLNNCVLKGTNSVTWEQNTDGYQETWNGIGAITGVAQSSNMNVEIVEGATVTLNYNNMTTDAPFVDTLTGYIAANAGTITNNGTIKTTVSDAATLAGAVSSGADVTLSDNVTAPLSAFAIYGTPVAAIQKGGVLDGDGHSLDIENPQYNGYAIETYGGTIKNLTVNTTVGRGIVISSPTEDICIDNVVIDGPGYAINTTEHSAKKLIVTGSTINGWTSFAGLESASFTNCSFGENTEMYWQTMGYGQDYDRLIRPYVNATFTDCVFEQDFYIDLSALGAGCTITLKNCTCNGVVINADNYNQYIFVELPGGRNLVDCVTFQ